jgi:hypothetical protein
MGQVAGRQRGGAGLLDDLTWIYAFQMGEDGPVKIGRTSNPKQRRRTLQQASPYALHVLACWQDWPETEKLLHNEFATAHTHGEWFRPTTYVLDLADEYGDEYQQW